MNVYMVPPLASDGFVVAPSIGFTSCGFSSNYDNALRPYIPQSEFTNMIAELNCRLSDATAPYVRAIYVSLACSLAGMVLVIVLPLVLSDSGSDEISDEMGPSMDPLLFIPGGMLMMVGSLLYIGSRIRMTKIRLDLLNEWTGEMNAQYAQRVVFNIEYRMAVSPAVWTRRTPLRQCVVIRVLPSEAHGAPQAACPHCEVSIPPGASFCSSCGDMLGRGMCPHCMVTISSDASFCSSCGSGI
eukprot:NODE_3211_length_1023_cov_14.066735_g2953_i0.p1 GENE.NODE_3211_length_1023_cov_14.066735_g2953_i0~~NODE_3211_length_1023_cov_14.066735_g2953_i0.p1  ORF type:complete len:242 (-),score=15.77 NODE_3211_length_1023_cov_14.066735_g2953_i0:173-898(-)